MIKLTLVVGFLAVFGLVGYAIIVLLINKFGTRKPINKPKTKK